METAFVTPKSRKAKNRLSNLMNGDNEVIVEQHLSDRVFVTSKNGKNHFWVNLNSDNDWGIEF